MLQAGTTLHDRYRLLRRVGRGGMGAVYEAVDTRLRNTVAVKQLTISGAAADRAFEREARLLAGLRHPALPVVIDYFLTGLDAFLVMQYIEGEDLEHHLARHRRPCSRDEVIAWAHALLDGLEYLHSHTPAIVHRDIKPSNVKRTPAGAVVLLDFGLAKGRLDADQTVAPDNSLYGFTLQYAPLEQIDGRGTDERSDLFALGATLYHLATGAPPPTAVQRMMAIRNRLADPLVAADMVYPAVGSVLSAALSRALQLDPIDRFASAAEMRAALSGLAVPAPKPAEPLTVERRVDAALPSQVEVGRQTDLLVQVRFAESPLLGIEDWPTKRRPEHVDQQSEPLHVTHPVDPATGLLSAARVRIKVVASDFSVEGDADRMIEVPVDNYSKRIAFLLTPRRTGFCRVNIEVYALDSLYLGTVAVEAESVGAGVEEPVITVANMVLGTFAREHLATDATTVVTPTAETQVQKAVERTGIFAGEDPHATMLSDPIPTPMPTPVATQVVMRPMPKPAAAPPPQDTQVVMRPTRQPAPPADDSPRRLAAAAEAAAAAAAAARKREASVAPAPVAAAPVAAAPVAPSRATPPPARSAAGPPPRTTSRYARLAALGSAAALVVFVGVVYITLPMTRLADPNASPPVAQPTVLPPPVEPAAEPTPATRPRPVPVNPGAAQRPTADAAPSTAGPPAPTPPPPDAGQPAVPEPPPAARPTPPASAQTPPSVVTPPVAATATQALAAAARLEAGGDLAEALKQLERARELDPTDFATGENIARLRARMRREGDEAFRNAKQFDAMERAVDAIVWYERAVKALPDEDPNKQVARDRLAVLRGRE